jgi:anti-sigma B factor antagonist
MKIETEEQGAHTVVRMQGVFALGFAAQALAEVLGRLETEKTGATIVDLTNLVSLDSTALGLLVGSLRRLRAIGRELILVNPNERIRILLSMTQLDSIFPIHGTTAEAFDALARKTGGETDSDPRPRNSL